MKILLLSDPESPHTIKWANALHDRGLKIMLFGLSDYDPSPYRSGIQIESFKIPSLIKNKLHGNFLKSVYLIKLPALRKAIKLFKPDILHSHYASSYGLMGALSGFHPLVISVWGTDVYIFPNVSFIHKSILKYVLSKADLISSTSHAMKEVTATYTNNDIKIVSFGVDLDIFKPNPDTSKITGDDIVIGTIKRLENEAGIENLIYTFSLIVSNHPLLPLKLMIVGGGSLDKKYKSLAKKLKIENKTIFTGVVAPDQIPKFHNKMNIEVYLSKYESFGVAVLEALACENPVVVSNVGGLPEIVNEGKTGFIVTTRNPIEAVKAIEKLITDKELRGIFGKAGRQKVIELYDWEKSVDRMINIYKEIIVRNKYC